MNPLNSEEFVRKFHELKSDLKLNVLLINAKVLMMSPDK